MKKASTTAANEIRNFSDQKLTIGLDLGDRSRVRMEGWRQWRLGEEEKTGLAKRTRSLLTTTSLLMEGGFTQNPGPKGQ